MEKSANWVAHNREALELCPARKTLLTLSQLNNIAFSEASNPGVRPRHSILTYNPAFFGKVFAQSGACNMHPHSRFDDVVAEIYEAAYLSFHLTEHIQVVERPL